MAPKRLLPPCKISLEGLAGVGTKFGVGHVCPNAVHVTVTNAIYHYSRKVSIITLKETAVYQFTVTNFSPQLNARAAVCPFGYTVQSKYPSVKQVHSFTYRMSISHLAKNKQMSALLNRFYYTVCNTVITPDRRL